MYIFKEILKRVRNRVKRNIPRENWIRIRIIHKTRILHGYRLKVSNAQQLCVKLAYCELWIVIMNVENSNHYEDTKQNKTDRESWIKESHPNRYPPLQNLYNIFTSSTPISIGSGQLSAGCRSVLSLVEFALLEDPRDQQLSTERTDMQHIYNSMDEYWMLICPIPAKNRSHYCQEPKYIKRIQRRAT